MVGHDVRHSSAIAHAPHAISLATPRHHIILWRTDQQYVPDPYTPLKPWAIPPARCRCDGASRTRHPPRAACAVRARNAAAGAAAQNWEGVGAGKWGGGASQLLRAADVRLSRSHAPSLCLRISHRCLLYRPCGGKAAQPYGFGYSNSTPSPSLSTSCASWAA